MQYKEQCGSTPHSHEYCADLPDRRRRPDVQSRPILVHMRAPARTRYCAHAPSPCMRGGTAVLRDTNKRNFCTHCDFEFNRALDLDSLACSSQLTRYEPHACGMYHTVIITGASRGYGEAVVRNNKLAGLRRLARHGSPLPLRSRIALRCL